METTQGNQQGFGVSDHVDPSAADGQELEAQTEGQEGQDGEQSLDSQEGQEDGQEVVTPFKDGKETFVIDGQEVEMTWDEAKKSIQLASASYKRFEDAKKIEKQAQTVLEQLRQKARENPEGLIRIFNPNWQGGTFQAQAQDPTESQRHEGQDNPWQQRYEELDQRYKQLEQRFEQQDIQAEQAKLRQEFSEVESNYPIFKDEATMAYLKSEYAKALRNGMDISLEDVAFTLSQKLERSRAEKLQSQQQRKEHNRNRAPVSAQPSAAKPSGGYNSFEDVKKSLGLV